MLYNHSRFKSLNNNKKVLCQVNCEPQNLLWTSRLPVQPTTHMYRRLSEKYRRKAASCVSYHSCTHAHSSSQPLSSYTVQTSPDTTEAGGPLTQHWRHPDTRLAATVLKSRPDKELLQRQQKTVFPNCSRWMWGVELNGYRQDCKQFN